MYPNLLGEMARRKVRQRDIATLIGRKEQTITRKMKMGSFTVGEALKIKAFLGTTEPLEVLFTWEV